MAISQFDLKNFADYIVFGQKRKAVKFQRFQTALISCAVVGFLAETVCRA